MAERERGGIISAFMLSALREWKAGGGKEGLHSSLHSLHETFVNTERREKGEEDEALYYCTSRM